MSPYVALIIGAILALAGTILACVFIIPKKKEDELKGFWKWLHGVFNFKHLAIEKIIKFFYILSTLACILVGFFMLFSGFNYGFGFKSYAGYGILIMILGPIVVRIVYELLMMFILLVQNTIDINNKLPNKKEIKDEPKDEIKIDVVESQNESQNQE